VDWAVDLVGAVAPTIAVWLVGFDGVGEVVGVGTGL